GGQGGSEKHRNSSEGFGAADQIRRGVSDLRSVGRIAGRDSTYKWPTTPLRRAGNRIGAWRSLSPVKSSAPISASSLTRRQLINNPECSDGQDDDQTTG